MRQQSLVGAIKTERVDNFHQNTLKALKKPLQAAGLQHPRNITAYFSPSWTAFQTDRGRDFSGIVDGVSV